MTGHLAATEDGLRRAFADARRRRFRTAGLSTSGVAAAVVLVAALAGGQGTQSLVEQPAPEQPAVSHPVPVDGGAARANSVSVVSPQQAGVAAGATTATRADRLHPSVPTSDHGTRPAQKAYAAGPLPRNDNGVFLPTPECNVTGKPEDATSLCPSSTVNAQTSGSTTDYLLYADICSSRPRTTTLHFPRRNEVDFAVLRGSTEVWRWSRWHPDTLAPHTVDLTTGACSSWTFDWSGVDASGRALAPGTYTLRTTFLVDELAGQRVQTHSFEIS